MSLACLKRSVLQAKNNKDFFRLKVFYDLRIDAAPESNKNTPENIFIGTSRAECRILFLNSKFYLHWTIRITKQQKKLK